MNERKWLASAELMPLLKFLRGKAGTRTVRLFACACCRRIWPLLADDRDRQAVEVAEGDAEGQGPPGPREADRSTPAGAAVTTCLAVVGGNPNSTWLTGLSLVAEQAAMAAADAALGGPRGKVDQAAWEAVFDAELAAQCRALRDIAGNPFRLVTVSPACTTPQVVALAQAAYDERELPAGTLDPRRLAVLADALEDAGCTDPDLLNHLRGPGPHYRGCWAVDLLLGKGAKP
jgi:hypothetical protein